jgi:hypothetical protein
MMFFFFQNKKKGEKGVVLRGIIKSMKITSKAISPIAQLIASSPFGTTTQRQPNLIKIVSKTYQSKSISPCPSRKKK